MLRNWKFLVSLLEGRPHTVGAEVGVFEGECALGLLEGLPDLKQLICVDLWRFDQEFYDAMPVKGGHILNANWNKVIAKFYSNVVKPHRKRVAPLRMPSLKAAELISDESLDFAFIDANHSPPFVGDDIGAWLPKVKIGGTIAGHDYINKPNYGVIQAVNELVDGYAVDRRSRVWHATKERSTS